MKTNPAVRILAFLLCALSAAAAFWSGLVTLRYWDEMWTDTGYFSSSDYWEQSNDMSWKVQRLAELRGTEKRTYTETRSLSAIRANLDPAATNYRYELRVDDTGELVDSNLDGARLEDVAEGIQTEVFTLTWSEGLHDLDEFDYRPVREAIPQELDPGVRYTTEEAVDAEPTGWAEPTSWETVQVLRVWTGEEYLEFPAGESPEGWNAYGWHNSGGEWDLYSYERDSRVTFTSYALRSGVAEGLPVDDDFRSGLEAYNQWHDRLPELGVLSLVSSVVFLLTLTFLCLAAGHREGVEGIALTWADRIPLEVLACAAFCVVMAAAALCADIYYGLNEGLRPYRLVGLTVISSVATAGGVGFVLTTAARLKARMLLDTLLTWRFCRWCWRLICRFCRAVAEAVKCVGRTLSMDVRLGLAFLVYLGLNAVLAWGLFLSSSTGFYLIGLVLFNGGAFWLGCRWIEQWKRIRVETGRVLGGDTTAQINTAKMYPDLKQHAEQLNDLGASINRAVDERLKSEHFKAELITNVSHDLKTPLTSIINYVDLLKKTDIRDPKALEYLEVLDRKSQRLKKLTEDLVEASKASTGNVTVNASRLDLVEFTQQAAAEYQDRLALQRLTLITKMADHPVYISADGRHLWRILDNLLGNCVKYALEGTRVYLDVVEWDGKGCISVKNISRDELNISPEELTERFVRGDESRTTEGSGLGLSIARSLTEVQGGTFRVATDGDLFKATVYFPVVLALEESNLGERG